MRQEQAEAVAILAKAGRSPQDISLALGIPKNAIEEVTASRTTISTVLNEDDERLAEAMRGLAWQAVDHAKDVYAFGHPKEKMDLTRAVLGRTMGLVGLEQTQQVDQLRQSFEGMLRDMRGTDASIEEPHDLTTGPIAVDAYDPDERRDYGTPGPEQ